MPSNERGAGTGRPLRITLIIASMYAGGAERVAATLVNAWAQDGHAVTLLTLTSAPSFYALDPAVRQVLTEPVTVASSTALDGVRNNLKRLRALRAAIRQADPDVIISLIDATNVRVLLASRGLGIPVVVSERVDPAQHHIGRQWSILRSLTYPWASAVVVQTEQARQFFGRLVRARVRVIANPVPAARVHADLAAERRMRMVVAMGRCVPQKGFDLLLQAFLLLAPRFPEWRLQIVGDGPDRKALQERAGALSLAGRVDFCGRVPDPAALLARADLFVLSSRFEGFPNALCEAMACGLPAVSFDCPSGPREIVRHEVDGLLVPPEDVGALAVAMARLMDDPALRLQYGQRAREVSERFSLERILGEWNSLIAEVRHRRA